MNRKTPNFQLCDPKRNQLMKSFPMQEKTQVPMYHPNSQSDVSFSSFLSSYQYSLLAHFHPLIYMGLQPTPNDAEEKDYCCNESYRELDFSRNSKIKLLNTFFLQKSPVPCRRSRNNKAHISVLQEIGKILDLGIVSRWPPGALQLKK